MLQEKATLLKAFEGIDQGNLSSFCGVEVDIKDNGITLSMQYYWEKIMKRFGISKTSKDDKPIKTKINRTDCPAKVNEERNAGTPTPPSPEPLPEPSPGGGEPENDTDVDVIFVSGLVSAISFNSQVNAFKDAYTSDAIIKSFTFETSNLPAIKEVLKLNPKIPIFLFSAGCQRITGLIDNPNLDKAKVFLIEPYTVNTVGRRNIESAIDSGVPSKNVYVGPTSDRGKNIDRDTTKVPSGTGHLDALKLAAKEKQQ
jgi:hypothetical protein